MLCSRENVTDLLLEDYVLACEAQNPGLVERTMLDVSSEIRGLLQDRYPLLGDVQPPLLRYIAAVHSAYRIVSAITTLVRSEGSEANEWIPLQQQWKRCNDLLKDLINGKIKLAEVEAAPEDDPSLVVISKDSLFNFRFL